MKKVLSLLALLIIASFWWRGHRTPLESLEALKQKSSEEAPIQKFSSSQPKRKSLTENVEDITAQSTHEVMQPHSPEREVAQKSSPQSAQMAIAENPASETSLGRSSSSSQEPAIGTVRILGHRGCDLNTQGWFLSKGRPDQYQFKVSDDGNSLVVEPITNPLDGNFEFIHCVGASQVVGKRVRFTAKIKAESVTKTAQIRLRGEDLTRENISGELTQVGGTHDWQDFAVEVDVKPEVVNFSYGLTFRSPGKLWISSPRLEILP